MVPFHVVALAGTKLNLCRQRTQQHTRGHRGRSGDPLYGIRRVARTRGELLSDRQHRRLDAVFGRDEHPPVAVTWRIYQDIIDAYADTDRRRDRTTLTKAIDTIAAVFRTGSTNSPSSDGHCTAHGIFVIYTYTSDRSGEST